TGIAEQILIWWDAGPGHVPDPAAEPIQPDVNMRASLGSASQAWTENDGDLRRMLTWATEAFTLYAREIRVREAMGLGPDPNRKPISISRPAQQPGKPGRRPREGWLELRDAGPDPFVLLVRRLALRHSAHYIAKDLGIDRAHVVRSTRKTAGL